MPEPVVPEPVVPEPVMPEPLGPERPRPEPLGPERVGRGPQRERLGRLLAMTAKVAREHFDTRLVSVGSSFNTYLIVKMAATYPGLSQRKLADIVGIEGPTLTHHLDRLTADGLLERVRHPDDRRVYRVELTAAGRAHLDRVDAYADQWDDDLRELLTDGELETLYGALTRIRDHYTTKEVDTDVFNAAG